MQRIDAISTCSKLWESQTEWSARPLFCPRWRWLMRSKMGSLSTPTYASLNSSSSLDDSLTSSLSRAPSTMSGAWTKKWTFWWSGSSRRANLTSSHLTSRMTIWASLMTTTGKKRKSRNRILMTTMQHTWQNETSRHTIAGTLVWGQEYNDKLSSKQVRFKMIKTTF